MAPDGKNNKMICDTEQPSARVSGSLLFDHFVEGCLRDRVFMLEIYGGLTDLKLGECKWAINTDLHLPQVPLVLTVIVDSLAIDCCLRGAASDSSSTA